MVFIKINPSRRVLVGTIMNNKKRKDLRDQKIKKRKEEFLNLSEEQKRVYALEVHFEAYRLGIIEKDMPTKEHSVSAVALANEWARKDYKRLKPRVLRYAKKFHSWSHIENVIAPQYLNHDYSLTVFYEALEMYVDNSPL